MKLYICYCYFVFINNFPLSWDEGLFFFLSPKARAGFAKSPLFFMSIKRMLMAQNVVSSSPLTLPVWGHSSTWVQKEKLIFMVSAKSQTLRINNPMKSVFCWMYARRIPRTRRLLACAWEYGATSSVYTTWLEAFLSSHLVGLDDDDSDALLLFSNSTSHADEFDFGETRPPG